MKPWTACCCALLALAGVATVEAAEVYRCLSPEGRLAFSDQPCPSGDDAAQVRLQGQPRIADDAPPDQQQDPPREEEPPPEPPAEPPPPDDPRNAQLRRLNFLVGQLVNGVAQVGNDCDSAVGAIRGWLKSSRAETLKLFPAWSEVQAGEGAVPGDDLVALAELIRKQLRDFESETLTRLTARCWDSTAVGQAVDEVRAALSRR